MPRAWAGAERSTDYVRDGFSPDEQARCGCTTLTELCTGAHTDLARLVKYVVL